MITPATQAVLAERQRPWAEAGWALAPEEARSWEQSGTAVRIARVHADPGGGGDAVRARRIVAWLNRAGANLDPPAGGWPAPAVRAAAFDFTRLSESAPEAAGFYRRCDRLFSVETG
jgi:hypothetical protein